jgi:hypothetical protein
VSQHIFYSQASVTTECEPVDCPLTLVKVDNVQENFITKKCESQPKQITHTKTRQVPKTVVKKLCNTIWKIDADGEKEWAGEDQCQEVEWQVYEEEEYEAVLDTTEVVCTDDNEIPYTSCQQTEYTSNQICLQCKVGVSMEQFHRFHHHVQAVAQPMCEYIESEMCGVVEITSCKPQVS